jgi:hypothetical protein
MSNLLTEPTAMTSPKRAEDFIELGVKCWKAALSLLEPYANAHPPGYGRQVLVNQLRFLRQTVDHAEQTLTRVGTPKPAARWHGLDRRGRTRPPNPNCPACHASPADLRVTFRTAGLVYFKCNRCGEPLTVDLPQPTKRR